MSSCLSQQNLGRARRFIGILAGILANYHFMSDDLGSRLARNVRELRLARGLTQEQMAKLAGVPRATWSNLESGSGNPTLTVLHAVCNAFQVSLEEIVAEARANARLYPKGSLPLRTRGEVQVSSLLPDKIPGMQIERLELPVGSRMVGVPHTPGTREYLTCESGEIELVASGEAFRVNEGDVVVFRGDQRHSYTNVGRKIAVGYSVVMLKQLD
ncbi:MAG TPA: helix-turn-helix domain-containing protein [Polyangiaceae bacterium]|jgi:transcriptional regulator with XRE-family HTH domain|nr:helix-turn-helix domain-containing protein [Polyangiaceae bacterium]